MRWCHLQLRAGTLSGPEWEGRERSYRVNDFLFNFADAFDLVIDRMMESDPYVIAQDMMLMLDWQGGVRSFECAMRLGNRDLRSAGAKLTLVKTLEEENDMEEAEKANEDAKLPLQSWGRMLELASKSFGDGSSFGIQQAIDEKRRVSWVIIFARLLSELIPECHTFSGKPPF